MIFPTQLRDEPGDLRAAKPRHPERDHAGPLPAQERRHAGTAQEELTEENQHGRRYVRERVRDGGRARQCLPCHIHRSQRGQTKPITYLLSVIV